MVLTVDYLNWTYSYVIPGFPEVRCRPHTGWDKTVESLGTPAYVLRCHKMLSNTGRSPYGMGSGFQYELQDIAIAFSLHIQFLKLAVFQMYLYIIHFALSLAAFKLVGAKHFKTSDNMVELLVGVHYKFLITTHGASTGSHCNLLSIVQTRFAVNMSTAHVKAVR